MSQTPLPRQPELNLGTLGHVDNGKSTLVQSLTGVWTPRHSEELRRGITIKVGYADAAFYKCPNCSGPGCYCVKGKCPNCDGNAEFLRAVSFVDCPGHHSLMITMLSGAALMDGALLVLAANARCPQPQDREHLAATEIVGINKVVVVQNKIDIVTRDRAVESYKEIRAFTKGTKIEDAPIIPVSAAHSTNIDLLVKTVEERIPTPKRDPAKPPKMFVVRSFDVNKPGTPYNKILGGVIGGTIVEGEFSVGDEIEIVPGIHTEKGGKSSYEPLTTTITSLQAGGRQVENARCGGLVGVGTLLDPSLTKADGLVGDVIGEPGHLPPLWRTLPLDVTLFDKVVGTEDQVKVEKIKFHEPLVTNVNTSVSAGVVTSIKDSVIEIDLRRPVCAQPDERVSISRRVGEGWRLIGYGIIKK